MADSQLTRTDSVSPVEYRDIEGFPGYRIGSDGQGEADREEAGDHERVGEFVTHLSSRTLQVPRRRVDSGSSSRRRTSRTDPPGDGREPECR